jgi:cytochrome P450
MRKMIQVELDGDEHTRYRRLLTPLFSPRAIRPLEDSVRERATTIIKGFADAKTIEFVGALARPLPSWVFLDLFGAPYEQAEQFTSWVRGVLHPESAEAAQAAGGAIAGYIMQTIAEHRAQERQDLIGDLMKADFEGRPLTDEEIFDIGFLLFLGGLDTVTNQLSVMAHHLATHPAEQEALRADPGRLDAVLDELLRLKPIAQMPRRVVQEVKIGAATFKPGDTVLVSGQAMPRSEATFPNATEAKFDREQTWTAAFGMGAHRCLGIHLARLELRVVMELLITHAPPFRLADGSSFSWQPANIWGPDRLDLEFVAK